MIALTLTLNRVSQVEDGRIGQELFLILRHHVVLVDVLHAAEELVIDVWHPDVDRSRSWQTA